ncbi:hypothetical protein C8R45DRAFT_926531 [Mycena sanguinolenta]|nr:hypothetical protein C8R45DRAFT_926531 [Mycena sanguinolenta]
MRYKVDMATSAGISLYQGASAYTGSISANGQIMGDKELSGLISSRSEGICNTLFQWYQWSALCSGNRATTVRRRGSISTGQYCLMDLSGHMLAYVHWSMDLGFCDKQFAIGPVENLKSGDPPTEMDLQKLQAVILSPRKSSQWWEYLDSEKECGVREAEGTQQTKRRLILSAVERVPDEAKRAPGPPGTRLPVSDSLRF